MHSFQKSSLLLALTVSLTFSSCPAIAGVQADTEDKQASEQSLPAFQPTQQEGSAPYAVHLKYNSARKYILGPNDVLSIGVLEFPEFTQKGIRVQPDGNIFPAGIGPLNVSGMTVEELYEVLQARYKHIVRNPQISINLDNIKPFIVYVTGSVLNPGSFELEADTSKFQPASSGMNTPPEVQVNRKTPLLSNVLIAAGGLTYTADLEHIKITNKQEGSQIVVNLLDLLEKQDSEQDLYLMPGDTVEVPSLPVSAAADGKHYKRYSNASFSQKNIPVRIYGFVNMPGLIKLEANQSNRLNSAIAQAGGYSQGSSAAPGKVFVSRVMENGRLATFAMDPTKEDASLLPNDVVYVPEKTRTKVVKAFDYMSRLIAPANTAAMSYNNWALMFNPTRQYGGPTIRN